MRALLNDLYYQPKRRQALIWGLNNLIGEDLRLFYHHARSVPSDMDLVNRIGYKMQATAGIGQALEPGADIIQTGDPKPAPKEKTKEPEESSYWWLWILLVGGGLWAWSKKKI
jgi:hypothetical protein